MTRRPSRIRQGLGAVLAGVALVAASAFVMLMASAPITRQARLSVGRAMVLGRADEVGRQALDEAFRSDAGRVLMAQLVTRPESPTGQLVAREVEELHAASDVSLGPATLRLTSFARAAEDPRVPVAGLVRAEVTVRARSGRLTYTRRLAETRRVEFIPAPGGAVLAFVSAGWFDPEVSDVP